MKSVAVTGGSGKAGRAVVDGLREHAYDVVDLDLRTSLHPDDPTLVIDLTDRGQVYDSLGSVDAVDHLAAIPARNRSTAGAITSERFS